ncbi:tail fiber domain-containing protein [Bdellovibrionales bacterium]|nr:tail fiber domain-containing protein [Bdellovibrionales bacterium]
MYVYLLFLSVMSASCFNQADAGSAPQDLFYSGQIIKPNLYPLEAANVVFNLRILSPGDECILLEETHTLDMSGSEGSFTLIMGTGARTGDDTGLSVADIFSNTTNRTGLVCATGSVFSYSPTSEDRRSVRVSFDDGDQNITISPDHQVGSVPYSLVSSSLQGKIPSSFVNTDSTVVTQTKANDLFGQHSVLMDLAAGTSSLYLTTGGSGALDMGSGDSHTTGSFGIGTSTPDADLEISSTTTADILLTNTGSGSNQIKFNTGATEHARIQNDGGSSNLKFYTNGSQAMEIDSSQSVNFSNNALFAGFIDLGDFTNASEATLVTTYLSVCGSGGEDCRGVFWNNSDSDQLKFWDGSSVRTIANSSGTFNPGGAIYTDGTNLLSTATGAAGYVLVSNGTSPPAWSPVLDSGKLDTNSGLIMNSGKLRMDFTIGEINQLQNIDSKTISNSQWGFVGALTGQPFQADGTVSMSGNVKLNGNWLSNDGGSEGLYVDTSGNVGVGTSALDQKLVVNGSVKATNYLHSSDRRWKRDIVKIIEAIDILEEIDGVSYFWRQKDFPTANFDDKLQYGVIAQDVERVLPDAVHTDSNGFKQVNYSQFTPILIEAVKELSSENRALQEKLKHMEKMNRQINDRLLHIEQMLSGK